MSYRTAFWLAWLLAGLSVAMVVASVALWLLARSTHVPSIWGADLTVGGLLRMVLYLAFPIVGALIASRRPHNPIGWILLADGFLWMLTVMFDYYSVYGVARPGSVPFPVGVYAASLRLWVPAVGLLGTYLILLFPDGRLPSRRWRPLAWLCGAVLVLLSTTGLFVPQPLPGFGGVTQPVRL
jgi:hypothetical protein